MGAALRLAVVHRVGRVEGAGRNQEPLEEDALLELEVVVEHIGHIGGLDGEGDGDVGLLEDVVDLEVANDAARLEVLHLDGEVGLLGQLLLILQHVQQVVLNGVGQLLKLLGPRVIQLLVELHHDLELANDLILVVDILRRRHFCAVLRCNGRQLEVLADGGHGPRRDGLVGPRLHHLRLEVAASGLGRLEGEEAAGDMLRTLGPTILYVCGNNAEEVPAPEVDSGVGALLLAAAAAAGLHTGRGDAGAGQ